MNKDRENARKQDKTVLQWHPAFFADIQIELQEDADSLIFENEHQLGTKPMEIDVLVIKKEDGKMIHKNIGRIFRKHNIIEYKSPDDYLSIDDFYKVYGYACFYKAYARAVNMIQIQDLTISLVCSKYPRKLMNHLKLERKYRIQKIESGIYYVNGDVIPVQLIVISELDPNRNLWLRSLTNHLDNENMIRQILGEYNGNLDNTLYRSAMNMIVKANKDKFKEGDVLMCEALEELFMEIMPDRVQKLMDEAQKARDEETAQKIEENAVQINKLTSILLEEGRIDDVKRASEDRNYQKKLLKEFGLLSEKV